MIMTDCEQDQLEVSIPDGSDSPDPMLKALEQSRQITEVPNFGSVPQHVICFIDSALLRHANQCCALPAGTEGVNEAFRIIVRDGVCDHEE